MTLGNFLTHYNGQCYVYENVYNERGDIIDNECVAERNTINKALKARKINDIDAGMFFINIYLKDK